MFPALSDLKTESDVEQKLIWPLLTNSYPDGLGYSAADIATKLSTRRLEIGKGPSRKLFYPDYLALIAGLPVLVVEAKAVGQSIEVALDEARLYANEINALFPHGVNPCARVVACNGSELWTGPVDTESPDLRLDHADLSPAIKKFAEFVDLCRRETNQTTADSIRRKLRAAKYVRPMAQVGGDTFQNEELPQNTFGATIAGDYGHIFNPKSRSDRALIAREAYIPSLRRARYVEPIDRVIRNAVAPSAAKIRPLEDTSNPREITAALRDRKKLENQVLLLIGSVGAGKSTFVDHLSAVALPQDLRSKTIWARLNLNVAPLSIDLMYDWVAKSLVDEFRTQFTETDFDDIALLQKIFAPELAALVKGPLAMLEKGSTEYRVRVADRLTELLKDPFGKAKAIARHFCGGTGTERLLVIVLDNCDKRTKDEQLTMFQVAQWVQSEFRALVVLPLR